MGDTKILQQLVKDVKQVIENQERLLKLLDDVHLQLTTEPKMLVSDEYGEIKN